MKILVIEALDHFSTGIKNESSCIGRFIGEYIGEDENYVFLRHIKAHIDEEDSAEEIHKVLKKVILRSKVLEFLDFDKKEETIESDKNK